MGSLTCVNRLNWFRNSGVPPAEVRVLPLISTDGVLENALPLRREVPPGDVAGMATAITAMLGRANTSPVAIEAKARDEAERLFAPEVICEQISGALEGLLAEPEQPRIAEPAAHAGTAT